MAQGYGRAPSPVVRGLHRPPPHQKRSFRAGRPSSGLGSAMLHGTGPGVTEALSVLANERHSDVAPHACPPRLAVPAAAARYALLLHVVPPCCSSCGGSVCGCMLTSRLLPGCRSHTTGHFCRPVRAPAASKYSGLLDAESAARMPALPRKPELDARRSARRSPVRVGSPDRQARTTRAQASSARRACPDYRAAGMNAPAPAPAIFTAAAPLEPQGSCTGGDVDGGGGGEGLLTSGDFRKLRAVMNGGLSTIAVQMNLVDPMQLVA